MCPRAIANAWPDVRNCRDPLVRMCGHLVVQPYCQVMLLRPLHLRRDVTAVVFDCEESALATFDVESGPCVPLMSGGNPLVDPLCQDGGETPALTAALYTALTGRPAKDAFVGCESRGSWDSVPVLGWLRGGHGGLMRGIAASG